MLLFLLPWKELPLTVIGWKPLINHLPVTVCKQRRVFEEYFASAIIKLFQFQIFHVCLCLCALKSVIEMPCCSIFLFFFLSLLDMVFFFT